MDLPNRQLSMTVLMTPDMANFAGKVHGGAILKLLDQVAYACASRYAGRYDGKPAPVPALQPHDDVERTRFDTAVAGKRLRMKNRGLSHER